MRGSGGEDLERRRCDRCRGDGSDVVTADSVAVGEACRVDGGEEAAQDADHLRELSWPALVSDRLLVRRSLKFTPRSIFTCTPSCLTLFASS